MERTFQISMVSFVVATMLVFGGLPYVNVHADNNAEKNRFTSIVGPAMSAPPIEGSDVAEWYIGYSWSMQRVTYKSYWQDQGGTYVNVSSDLHEWSWQIMNFTFTVTGIDVVEHNGEFVRVYIATGIGEGYGYVKTVSGGYTATARTFVDWGDGTGYRHHKVDDLSLIKESLDYTGGIYLKASVCNWTPSDSYTTQRDRFVYTNESVPLELYDFPIKIGEAHDLDVSRLAWGDNYMWRGNGGLLCGLAGENNKGDYSKSVDKRHGNDYDVAIESYVSTTVGPVTADCYLINATDKVGCPAYDDPVDGGEEFIRTYYNATWGLDVHQKGAMMFDTIEVLDGGQQTRVYYKWRDLLTDTPVYNPPSRQITSRVVPSVAEQGSYVYVDGYTYDGGAPVGMDLKAEIYGSPMESLVSSAPSSGYYNTTLVIPGPLDPWDPSDDTPTTFDLGSRGVEVWDRAGSPPASWTHSVSTLTIISQQPPMADTTGSDTEASVGVEAFFDGRQSSDNDRVVSWEWNWGDGNPDGNGKTANHVFQEAGEYLVTLTVTDAAGLTDQDTVLVNVASGNIVHSISYEAGWNLISVAVDLGSGEPLSTVLADEWENIDSVYCYDTSARSWVVYDRGAPHWISQDFDLHQSMGIWVNFATAGKGVMYVTGPVLSSTDVQLYAGWNLIGFPSSSEEVASTVLAGVPVDTINGYD
ncbi:MAG TPA: PKD domain-containing protein, partial [Euryarchaeota archaeon]|nr:PKD domain-containing protein [Euryarchaeota archaeon]